MAKKVFKVYKSDEYRKAGSMDLIELVPPPGCHPIYIVKWLLDTCVYGIVNHEFMHISGPTGSGKSSLIDYLYLEPKNFKSICSHHGYRILPLRLYAIEMATYETPGELIQRRALKNGVTFDEPSKLIEALEDSERNRGEIYPVIWLREMGRVHSPSIQGGLLNLMTKGDIIKPDGTRISGREVAWITDSNYQVEHDSNHTLVPFDDALKRRFCLNLTLEYLSIEQEVQVLEHILREESKNSDEELIVRVVQLGNLVRRQRSEGNMQSVPPPTIWGYLSFLRLANSLPSMTVQQVASATLLGNAGAEDRNLIPSIINEVFGLRQAEEGDISRDINLF